MSTESMGRRGTGRERIAQEHRITGQYATSPETSHMRKEVWEDWKDREARLKRECGTQATSATQKMTGIYQIDTQMAEPEQKKMPQNDKDRNGQHMGETTKEKTQKQP